MIHERIRVLQAPADDAAASGTGDTSTTDAGQDKQQASADTGQVKGKEQEQKTEGEKAEKRSVLKASDDGKAGKTDDSKQDAGAKAKDGAAASEYVVELPEGTQLDKARLDSFTKAAKEAGITAKQAGALAAFQLAAEKEQAAAQVQTWAKQGEDWYGELEKDGEFGGAKIKESEAALQRALKAYDPKGELVRDLEKWGIENLPSLAKFLRRVGQAGAEDKSQVETHRDLPQATPEQERLAKRYPSIKGIQPHKS